MSDARRRGLEREADTDLLAAAEALGERLRAGELRQDELGLLCFLEVPGAVELLAQLDPDLLPRRTWPAELAELATLSLAPTPGRFCFEAWPGPLALAARLAVSAAAPADSLALREAPGFPETISESLLNAILGEAVAGSGPSDFAEALVVLRDAPGWAARGGQAPLYLQAFAPVCRALGVSRVESLVREGLLEAVLGRPGPPRGL